jgi:hypothetical protein
VPSIAEPGAGEPFSRQLVLGDVMSILSASATPEAASREEFLDILLADEDLLRADSTRSSPTPGLTPRTQAPLSGSPGRSSSPMVPARRRDHHQPDERRRSKTMRAQQQDHYVILGVAPDASPAHITHAYRNLLRRHHPDTRAPASDVPGEDHDLALQRILTAYAVLHDSQQRAVYDQHRLRQSVRPIVVSRADDESIQTTRPVRRPPTPPIQAGPVRWHYRVEQPN